MNKFVYLLITFLFTNYVYSQHIEVDYKIITLELQKINEVKDIPDSVIESMKESFELIKSIKMVLNASKTESYFFSNTKLANDANSENFRMAQIMIGSNDVYHSNLLKNKTKRYFTAYGEKLIMETSIKKLNWILTKETKTISGYLCYKAETNYLIKNSLGSFNKKIIAYYTPEINYRFGPKGFCGLPGLILELQDDKFVYVVENIKFKKENLKLKKLPKGKIVTEDELNKIGDKIKENRKW
ncbi:GLPGLI family protein [Psychroserpens sp. SPM9]|uniref:GLPGLI family protein n=1 Tax=Psychroserpens sp. SPM9 TaxID=2975598 RepID=UPI0021A7A00F|nr:GLPGLI family protein [Psychroserpens sp. SPM9]MDG5491170.1 GLPGLI family protein [Psychroserpens sp. SPM9]